MGISLRHITEAMRKDISFYDDKFGAVLEFSRKEITLTGKYSYDVFQDDFLLRLDRKGEVSFTCSSQEISNETTPHPIGVPTSAVVTFDHYSTKRAFASYLNVECTEEAIKEFIFSAWSGISLRLMKRTEQDEGLKFLGTKMPLLFEQLKQAKLSITEKGAQEKAVRAAFETLPN